MATPEMCAIEDLPPLLAGREIEIEMSRFRGFVREQLFGFVTTDELSLFDLQNDSI